MTERDRIMSVLKRRKPDRVPWATRLDIWYGSNIRTRTLPPEYEGLNIMEIHDDLGLGRQSYVPIAQVKLHGVEVVVEFNGRRIYRESAPTLRFPIPTGLVPRDEPGETVISFKAPVGTARVRYSTNRELLDGGASPYLTQHILSDDSDYQIVHWILDHSQVVADYDPFAAREAEIGERGFTIGMMERVPFQRIVLDFMGEERCFYEMHDHPERFGRLLDQLTEIDGEYVRIGIESPAFMLEYGDNFDGEITNPRLFERYCLPRIQEAGERIHAAGKVLGSHMDGDMKNLVELVPEAGLDVVESFSPKPLSSLTFKEAWEAWGDRVTIWGAIASPIFEAETPQDEFEREVMDILTTAVPDGLIILGIADQAVQRTLPDRIRRVGELIERYGYYYNL
ncbi:MAG: uroporphyrinogen decarboxylase family protein [bacterium]